MIAVRSVTSSSVRLCECWGQARTGLPWVALWACVTFRAIPKQQTDGVWQCDVCVTWHWRLGLLCWKDLSPAPGRGPFSAQI